MSTDHTNASVQKLSIDCLDTKHRQVFSRALQNVLSSDAAELTYGQIVDGLPLSDIETDSKHGSVDADHPIHTKHTELCPGVLERFREIWRAYDISCLKFDSTLIDGYKNASPGSTPFETRLVEMIVVAVHQIAVQLFKSETSLHEKDGMGDWKPDEDSSFWDCEKAMFPTLFRHEQYCDYDQYPNGMADGVAYWAEDRIFGGVVLFDRRDPDWPPNENNDIEVDPDSIYFHSDKSMVTYRIYQLTEKQRCDLVNFLLSETTPPAECPIPILGNDENHDRVDPEESVLDTGVYRDVWERKTLGDEDIDPRKDVWGIDWTSYRDFCKTRRRVASRQRKIEMANRRAWKRMQH
ncbi:hypothetical protein F5Y12DRAFT_799294 [Xylaria sp. FL1777]|nr:hypothetical protein F5Y12DRAFT_799294 [Xylaria sp. FL1777]